MNAQETKQTKKEVVKKDFEFIKLSELTGKELKDHLSDVDMRNGKRFLTSQEVQIGRASCRERV